MAELYIVLCLDIQGLNLGNWSHFIVLTSKYLLEGPKIDSKLIEVAIRNSQLQGRRLYTCQGQHINNIIINLTPMCYKRAIPSYTCIYPYLSPFKNLWPREGLLEALRTMRQSGIILQIYNYNDARIFGEINRLSNRTWVNKK